MNLARSEFRNAVEHIVSMVPRGKVVTYGQVAALVGFPRTARLVGQVAHWGDEKIPWQRVVNRNGRVAPGYPGGFLGHAEALRAEEVEVRDDWTVDLSEYQWHPSEKTLDSFNLPPEAAHYFEQRLA